MTIENSKEDKDFKMALKVNQILEEAAAKIAGLGPKPKFSHPSDWLTE